MKIPYNISEYKNLWVNLTPKMLEEKWDMKLYHILPYKHFLQILKSKSLYFVNIHKSWWDEPYELFYFRPRYFRAIHSREVPLSVEQIMTRYYAQCWSENRDSDAMWRIYSGVHRDGVRISTTLGKIIQLLYPATNLELLPYVGFMQYEWKMVIKSWLNAHSLLTTKEWEQAAKDSLFIKRKNFSHEKEFRIILSAPTTLDGGFVNPWQDHATIPIDINDFIEEITFSPFIDKDLKAKHFRTVTRYLDGTAKINQSTLYLDDISKQKIVIKD